MVYANTSATARRWRWFWRSIKYRVIDPEEECLTDPDDSFFRMIIDNDLSDEYGKCDAAEECAMNFYTNHCGESYNWPLVFVLLGEGDEELGLYEVDVDARPRFSASEA